MNQPDGLQRILMDAIKDQASMEWAFDSERTHTLERGVPKAALSAKFRVKTKFAERGINGFLKAARYFRSRLPHLPQCSQRKVFAEVIGLLKDQTHPRFSSRMIRSTIARISSEE
jgi:hypothetical protein